MLLQRDAAYDESDEKQIARYPLPQSFLDHLLVLSSASYLQILILFSSTTLLFILVFRAAYCRNAIAISLSIKNNFHRYLPSQGDTNIVQYIIPYPMPAHMTTASFSFSDAVSHMELEPSTQVLQVTRTEETPTGTGLISLPPTAPIVQRVKRPYNKKASQSRLLPPIHPNGVSSLVPLAGYPAQIPMPMSMSNPALSGSEFPGHTHSHNYTQPHLSLTLSLAAVTEEATSDSGTDDDSCFKGDVTARSSTSTYSSIPSLRDIKRHDLLSLVFESLEYHLLSPSQTPTIPSPSLIPSS
jgi:hypothetical protein